MKTAQQVILSTGNSWMSEIRVHRVWKGISKKYSRENRER